MGFFDKKIQCTYCKESVDEEYAKYVGVCPHCSKRIEMPSSNSLLDNSNSYSSDLFSSDSYSSDLYSNDSYSGDLYSNDSFSSDLYSSDSYSGNLNSSNSNSSNLYSNSSNDNNSNRNNYNSNNSNKRNSNKGNLNKENANKENSNKTNVLKNSSSNMNRNAIDSDYIRRVNEEANARHNKNNSWKNKYSNRAYNNVNTPNCDDVYKSQPNKAAKIVFIAIIASFVLSIIFPIVIGLIGLIISNVSNPDETKYYEDYVSSNEYEHEDIEDIKEEINDYLDEYDDGANSFKVLESEEMTTFLMEYFGKSAADIKYEDLCEIKGFSMKYDYNSNIVCVNVYGNNDKNYTDFIENGFINVDELNNKSKKYDVEIPQTTNAYVYMNEMLKDISCFPNLEYFESNYSFTMYDYFAECKNLKAFIAPSVSVYSESFSEKMNVEYLSVFGFGDAEVLDKFPSIKSLRLNSNFEEVEENVLAVAEKCSNLESLYVEYKVNESVFSKMDGLVNLDIQGITNLNSIPCFNTLETLTLRFSSINDLTPISKYTRLTYLNISDDTIRDYSSLGSVSSLKTLILDPLNHDVTHEVSALAGLSNLECLSLDQIYDAEFVKSLKNLKELKLGRIDGCDVHDIVVSLPNLERLTLDYIYTEEDDDFSYLSSIDNIKELTIKDFYIHTDLTDLFITDSLEKLSITGCQFKADGRKLKDNNSLIHISVTDCRFPEYYYDENWEYQEIEYTIGDLAANMDKFKGLKTLNMEGCGLTAAPKVVEGVEVRY